jgi:hypothetical protein
MPLQPLTPAPRQRLSKAALAAFICGLVFIPIITGIAALVAGFVGIRATRDPLIAGRRFAVAGIILGVLNLVIWACLAASYVPTFSIRRAALKYIDDLNENRADVAASESTLDHQPDIPDNLHMVHRVGTVDDIEIVSITPQTMNGVPAATVSGFIGYTNSNIAYIYTLDLIWEDGGWKVSGFDEHR